MSQNKIKLIITDLDGTLLDGEDKVPHDFFHQIDVLFAQGIRVVIASGRQYFNIKNLFDHHVDKLHFIGDNGALGFYRDEQFHATFLPWKTAFELVEKGKQIPGVVPLISASQNTFFEQGNEETVNFIRQFYRQCVIVDQFVNIETKHEIPLKVAFYDRIGVKENSLIHFKNNHPGIIATPSNVHWLDIAPANTNKGAALKTLQEKYHISAEETLCFGDYHNDIEMLQKSHYSFAVASAQNEVKAVAKYQCKSNKDQGVIEVIQELINHEMKTEALHPYLKTQA